MVKTAIKVYVRNRPSVKPLSGLKIDADGKGISIAGHGAQTVTGAARTSTHTFKFDGCFDGAGQDEIYGEVAEEVVDGTLAGYNGTIFAYGQTGAGKTYTMSGHPAAYSRHRGIIPRATASIFREIDLKVEKEYSVKVSYLEIYNEALYDLLADSPGGQDLTIVERGGNVDVQGLSKVAVASEEEALEQFFRGEQMRSTAEHVLNSASSRSHSIFTIHVQAANTGVGPERAVLSKLNLVDLAGSERTKKTGALGQTLREASYINRSLSYLEQVVQALTRRDRHVPFRQSKLTSVLKDALGGNSRTVMVANIWGEDEHLDETLGTLRFATRVRLLQTDAVVNESNDPGFLMRKYERIIRELKQELAMRDSLMGRAQVSYDDLSDAELRDLRSLINRFVKGEVSDEALPTDTLKRVRETYRMFREVCTETQQRAHVAIERAKSMAGGHLAAGHDDGIDDASDFDEAADDGVGDLDRTMGGFHAGVAPSMAKPAEDAVTPRAGGARSPSRPGSTTPDGVRSGPRGARTRGATAHAGRDVPGSPGGDLGTRGAAYERYKQTDPTGRELAARLHGAQEELRGAKASLREATDGVNRCKGNIDRVSAAVAARREQAGTQAEITDQEFFDLLTELKGHKVQYRQEFDRVKNLRTEIEGLQGQIAEVKADMVAAFERWLEHGGGADMFSGRNLDAEGYGDEDDGGDGGGASDDPYEVAKRTARLRNARARGPGFGGARAVGENARRNERNLKAMALA
ncbi:unnamed protein product [Pedinophyceae sp. YPF-701]|nr:unnamed protein product [Pedinophyceae sp. YPF-701]